MHLSRLGIKAGLASILLVLIGYILVSVLVWSQQKAYIFMPVRELANTPADFGLYFENIFIRLEPDNPNSERLHAWWVPAPEDSAKTLLYLHGSAFNIAANIEHARRFQRLGFSVLLLSYRGYGRSDGQFPSESAMYADARTAWRYLVQQRQRPADRIYVYGHSLGGAVAVDLVEKHPEAAGLIVEGTFTSMVDMGRRDELFRLLPIDLIVNQRFDSLDKIERVTVPLLIIHGTEDALVPVDMARQLYAAANPPKTLKLILGGGHNNSARTGGQIYLDTVARFVSATAPSASGQTHLFKGKIVYHLFANPIKRFYPCRHS